MDEKFRQNVGGTNVSIFKNEVCPTNKIWIVIIESKIRPRIQKLVGTNGLSFMVR